MSRFAYVVLLALAVCGLVQAATLDTEEQTFVTLINNYRQSKGLVPLKISDKLDAAATWLSTDMGQKKYFSHTDSLGRSFATRFSAFGYTYATYKGENIAAGNATASATFEQWRNSSGHNANMLNANFRVMGIARVYTAGSPYGWYWTNDFGGYDDAGTPTTPAPTGDTTAPTLTVTAPTNGSTVSGTVAVRTTAADNVGVARVTFQVDTQAPTTDTTAPYETTVNTLLLTNGAHTITATAADAAGNTVARSVSVTVNNTTTTVAAPAAPTGLTITVVPGGARISWRPGSGGGAVAAYEVQVTAYVNGKWRYQTFTVSAPSTSLSYTASVTGTHLVHVRARNAAGPSPYTLWKSTYLRVQ